MSLPTSIIELRARFSAGERFNFLHFWGHAARGDGVVSQSCFSQWFEASFVVDAQRYTTAEHFMMAAKARLFNDDEVLEQVLAAKTPGAAKALGRKIAGFSDDVWLEHRFAIVCQANLAKFDQNASLREYLIRTGGQILVEASPTDRIWGIGMAKSDPGANDPNQWQGLNLLGFALMEVRRANTNSGI